MDKNQKLHILHQCNIIPIDSLDATIKDILPSNLYNTT